MNEYDEQAEKFLKETETIFKAEFLKFGRHFEDDTESRDIYKITLIRGERVYKFNFGQSVANSRRIKRIIPSAYDVLACLTSSEVGTFEDFCGDFGYNEDSRKAEKTYKAVLEEWQNIKMLYSDSEIEKLQEIQ